MAVFAVVLRSPGAVLPIAAAAVGFVMVVVWIASIALKDASIVDVVWGPAFAVVALVAAIAGGDDAGRRWLLLALTALWGLRLGLHVGRRKLSEPGEDRRYARMRGRHPGGFALRSLVVVFASQAVLVLVVSLPLQVAGQSHRALSAAVAPGVLVYVVGLLFEAIGDEQLRRFRLDPANRGRVMDRGLWRYTRHPNYFGDACVWWGLWLVAVQAGGAWWTAVGPLVMTLLLVRVSGKALLERDIGERRPGYREYVRRTSGFVPWPPRR